MAKTVLVVGGGAAGLMAALSAAQAGAKVEILEEIDRPVPGCPPRAGAAEM